MEEYDGLGGSMTFAEIIPGLLEGKRYCPQNGKAFYRIGFDEETTGELIAYYDGAISKDRWYVFPHDLTRDDWEEV